jgi:bifunctional non-homologous end joining protein LigD
MALKEYEQKRDFSRTREPRGQGSQPVAGNLYVVQKHAATRLHYDLRLELNGVLKSWAIPKGPSLDPAEKRLAVQVEDHPVEYGAFEGTIPKGEYGGGTVMLWDQGSWEPEEDPAEGFRKGKLSFRLFGKKLRGSWGLAQMKERGGKPGKNWLLIKHKDAEAVAEREYRIVEAQPLSVATRRSLDEIAAGKEPFGVDADPGRNPDPSRLTNARQAAQPKSLKPQLATLVDQPPPGDEWIHEVKLDGYRILGLIEAGRITLLSRSSKEWTGKFSAVAQVLQAFPVKQAILDGEIVVLRPDGTSDFQALQNFLKGGAAGRLVYYLFDLPHCNGYDLTRTPLLERKLLLYSLVARMSPANGSILRFSDHLRGSGEEVYRQACRLAAEGIVSKRAAGGYEQKRSRGWLKTKCMARQEFVVGGFTEPTRTRTGFGALLLGYYDHGELVYAGRVGTGFSEASLRQLTGRLRDLEQGDPPFRHPPSGAEGRKVRWVKPELVAEVEFREWTEGNILRQASFKGLREDKLPGEIGREFPASRHGGEKPSGEAREPAAPGRKPSASGAMVAGVRMTHPDKIMYPGQGITKRALAEFYETVADLILPHVIRRPLTLLRCPDGRAGECFYQKHLKESIPAKLRAIPIKEKEATEEYLVIDDLRGLISLVQLGVLEIHPWGSSEIDLEKPDILTFDLDPGPGIGWPQVIEGAKLLRNRLEELGLQSFVKTSGGKGLHLVVPIQRRTGWEEAKAFARAVSLDLVRLRPDRFVAKLSRAKRQGKIFIDYLRNDRGATTVAAYSTRAGAGAPVSTPIRWDELDKKLTPDRYRIDNLPKRLAVLKNDPWQDFFTIRQAIPRIGVSKMK